MALAPEQIDEEVSRWRRINQTWGEGNISAWGEAQGIYTGFDIAETLAAYADIVERVAEGETRVIPVLYPGGHRENQFWVRTPEEVYLAARKLRGKE